MTPSQLQACTGCKNFSLATSWLPSLDAAMRAYAIVTPVRQAYFLAQIGHESGGLVYTTELWGPTPTQARYEGRADLGNTQPGDGALFRGHGLIQVTGRANHAAARDRLRKNYPDAPDFEVQPELLAQHQWAALSAADYWDARLLNTWADLRDLDSISDIINRGHRTPVSGDANGYADRKALTEAACAALGA